MDCYKWKIQEVLAARELYSLNCSLLAKQTFYLCACSPKKSQCSQRPFATPTRGAHQLHADEKTDLFVTLSIVYIQISNTYLLEFLIASRLTLYKCVVNVCIQR